MVYNRDVCELVPGKGYSVKMNRPLNGDAMTDNMDRASGSVLITAVTDWLMLQALGRELAAELVVDLERLRFIIGLDVDSAEKTLSLVQQRAVHVPLMRSLYDHRQRRYIALVIHAFAESFPLDGVDQTALLLNGDTHSRRDYVFIYAGHEIGATVKGRYKRHWIGAGDVAASGMPEAYYDLYQDPREENPQLVPLIHTQGQFNSMLARHELFKKKYPDKPNAKGIPYTGLSNARPETKAIEERVKQNLENMPFDLKEYLEFEVPGSDSVGDWGH